MVDYDNLESLSEGVLGGDKLSLARLISSVEKRDPGYRSAMDKIYHSTGNAWVIGITGPPGVGKSTLVDVLIKQLRNRDLSVGIIAVDPSSPFTGGAVLGDRVRMQKTLSMNQVFCRSMSARGEAGGLSSATYDTIYLMDAFGFDVVLIETVGAGQSEVDIVKTADSVVVTTHPSSGDDIQTVKAGILEIGDIFVVNKADLDGADKTVQELKQMVHRRESPTPWSPPVVSTIATNGSGIPDLLENLINHREFIQSTDVDHQRQSQRVRNSIELQVDALVRENVSNQLNNTDELVEEVISGNESPYSIAKNVYENID